MDTAPSASPAAPLAAAPVQHVQSNITHWRQLSHTDSRLAAQHGGPKFFL